jgi:hypothetical protein
MAWSVLVDYASTIVGGVVVLVWLGSELGRAHSFAAVAHTRWRWLVISLLAVGAIAVGLWNGLRGPPWVNYWTGEMWITLYSDVPAADSAVISIPQTGSLKVSVI